MAKASAGPEGPGTECQGSQTDIETRMRKPAKGNSIKVRRSATEAGGRDAKIFVEDANRLLSYEADGRIPVFP
jgi:ribosomal protein L7/L12